MLFGQYFSHLFLKFIFYAGCSSLGGWTFTWGWSTRCETLIVWHIFPFGGSQTSINLWCLPSPPFPSLSLSLHFNSEDIINSCLCSYYWIRIQLNLMIGLLMNPQSKVVISSSYAVPLLKNAAVGDRFLVELFVYV